MLLIKKKNIQIHSDGSIIFSHLFKEKSKKTRFYAKDYKKLHSNKKKFKETK